MFAATAREADQARRLLVPLIQWSEGALRHRPDSRSSENWQRCIQPLSPRERMLHNDVRFNHLRQKNKKTQPQKKQDKQCPQVKGQFPG